MDSQAECKHDKGFVFVGYGWYCVNNCGYSLNFDPFTFPEGISIKNYVEVEKVLK